MIVGVGLMGQHLANHIVEWLDLETLVLADASPQIRVGTESVTLGDFAASVAERANGRTQVVAETINITSEEEVSGLFQRHPKVDYLQHTAGGRPHPPPPPPSLSPCSSRRAGWAGGERPPPYAAGSPP